MDRIRVSGLELEIKLAFDMSLNQVNLTCG